MVFGKKASACDVSWPAPTRMVSARPAAGGGEGEGEGEGEAAETGEAAGTAGAGGGGAGGAGEAGEAGAPQPANAAARSRSETEAGNCRFNGRPPRVR